MVGGTIRRKLIHRESFRVSVLHLSEIQAVLQSIATMRCVLTTPSFLSRGTRKGEKQIPRRVAPRDDKKYKQKPQNFARGAKLCATWGRGQRF